MKSVNCIKCLHHSCAQYSLQDVWVYVCAGAHTHEHSCTWKMFCLKFWVTFRKMMIHWTIYRMSLCYCHFNWRAHFLVFYYHNDFGRLICVEFKMKSLISHIMIIMSWQRYLYFVISYSLTLDWYKGKNYIFKKSPFVKYKMPFSVQYQYGKVFPSRCYSWHFYSPSFFIWPYFIGLPNDKKRKLICQYIFIFFLFIFHNLSHSYIFSFLHNNGCPYLDVFLSFPS